MKTLDRGLFIFLNNSEHLFFICSKKLFLFGIPESFFLGIRAGIIVDANIGNRKLNIPEPFWFKVIFYQRHSSY